MTGKQTSGRPGATVAQLQDDIDSGRTGDKIAGFDPAAAPLGTDDEAGGVPPDPQLVEKARAAEREGAHSSSRKNSATPSLQPDARLKERPNYLKAALVGALAAVLLAALLFLFTPATA